MNVTFYRHVCIYPYLASACSPHKLAINITFNKRYALCTGRLLGACTRPCRAVPDMVVYCHPEVGMPTICQNENPSVLAVQPNQAQNECYRVDSIYMRTMIIRRMSRPVDVLYKIVSRRGLSRMLTFDTPHLFKAIHTMFHQTYTSRQTLCDSLRIGEGAAKTLVLRLKQSGLADTIRAGMFLTGDGRRFAEEMFRTIPSQCPVGPCSVANQRYNHAILVRGYASGIGSGIDQRDYAIMYGAKGATTLAFEGGRFVFPNEVVDCLGEDPEARTALLDGLRPMDGDLVIIASADDPFVAEISAINSALRTLYSD